MSSRRLRKIKTFFSILILYSISLPAVFWGATLSPNGIGKNENYLTFNGNDFLIKSIYLLAWMPGENPAFGEQPLKADYAEIMNTIRSIGANTVSVLHALMPAEFYKQARQNGLKIIQGVWFNQTAEDFQNSAFKTQVKNDIKNMIDNYHNREGVDYSEDILFLNIGNELYETNIRATNTAHPEINQYSGTYISVPLGSNATECFLAEMCDYAVVYESNTYGVRHYVSHSTWSPVSPDILNTSFLDIISYNIYSYWPEWMLTHPGGSTTGTPYQGYIERMKSVNKTKPFYISEVGYSTAPQKVDSACVSEQEQADNIKKCWTDITTASQKIAGAAVFNYQDEWWTQANTASWPSQADEDEHAQDDREEWFGIIKVDGTGSANYTITKKPAFYSVQEMFTQASSSSTVTTSLSSTVRAFPNPCSQKNDGITFANVQNKTHIDIYSITGERIFQSQLSADNYQWDLNNNYGQRVAPGVYIVKISGENGNEFLKIAIK